MDICGACCAASCCGAWGGWLPLLAGKMPLPGVGAGAKPAPAECTLGLLSWSEGSSWESPLLFVVLCMSDEVTVMANLGRDELTNCQVRILYCRLRCLGGQCLGVGAVRLYALDLRDEALIEEDLAAGVCWVGEDSAVGAA